MSLQTRRFGWASVAGGTVFALIGLGMGASSLSFSFGSARAEGTKRQGAVAGVIRHLTDAVAPEVV